jgi:acyl-CoA synthetase (AMP-forming)/AMP-acid ligase II
MTAPATRHELHFGDRLVSCFADRPDSVDVMLRSALDRHGERDAVVDGDTRLSFKELDAQVAAVAGGLLAAGLKPGDRLALLISNRWQFVTALLAALRAGLIAVPLNVRASAPELLQILEDCAAAGIVHDGALLDRLPPTGQAPALRIQIEPTSDAPSFDDLLAANPVSPAVSDEEDVAIILYTSGTTGRPKGAMLTHLNIVHSCLHYAHGFAFTGEDRSLLAVPASHVTGVIAGILAPLAAGAAVIVMPRFDALDFLTLAARERMTLTVMVPAMYQLCLLRARLEDYDLSAWRVGAFGGAPMPPATIAALAQKLPRLMLAQAYGATETTSPATLMPLGEMAAHQDTVGRAVLCGELRIIDNAGRELPPGEAGEVWIKGPMVVPGYWRNPEQTGASFAAGFWCSGDIGSLDDEGYLCVFDRLKDLINRGGYKVYSAEVENVLARHPGVAEAAVVPKLDPVLSEKVHAFVHLADPGVTAEVLHAFCATELADYKLPDGFTLCPEPLPRNANGKLIKQVLRDRLATA